MHGPSEDDANHAITHLQVDRVLQFVIEIPHPVAHSYLSDKRHLLRINVRLVFRLIFLCVIVSRFRSLKRVKWLIMPGRVHTEFVLALCTYSYNGKNISELTYYHDSRALKWLKDGLVRKTLLEQPTLGRATSG
jgi:hypothetical protein